MDFYDRKEAVLAYLEEHLRLDYEKAVDMLGVSEATVRRDFLQLEGEGRLARIRGGARVAPEAAPMDGKKAHGPYTREQKAIGRIASRYVRGKELVYIGSGNTTMALIDQICQRDISVITNGIPQLEALAGKEIQTFLLAGFLKESTKALVGARTIEMLKEFRFDCAFLGANGLNREYQVLSGDQYEFEIKKIAMANAKRCFLLLDHGKFDKTAMYEIPGRDLHNVWVVTDQMADWMKVPWEKAEDGYVFRLEDAFK